MDNMKKLKENYYKDIVPHTIKDAEIMIAVLFCLVRDFTLTDEQSEKIPEDFKSYFETCHKI